MARAVAMLLPLAIAAIAAVSVAAQPIAQTSCGLLMGNFEQFTIPFTPQPTNMSVFRGIPFGAPPVGRQGRWHLPRPAACWTGVLNATSDAPICWQLGNVDPIPPQGQSEDCLYLNVYTRFLPPPPPFAADPSQPKQPQHASEQKVHKSKLKPVFVWIHGGSIVFGSASAYADIANLAALEDVVLVSIQYRLNAFGFLALEALHNDALAEDQEKQQQQQQHKTESLWGSSAAGGNFGVADMQLALAWGNNSPT